MTTLILGINTLIFNLLWVALFAVYVQSNPSEFITWQPWQAWWSGALFECKRLVEYVEAVLRLEGGTGSSTGMGI